jgi:hypothetical protein
MPKPSSKGDGGRRQWLGSAIGRKGKAATMTGKQPNVLLILSDQHHAKVLGHKVHPDRIRAAGNKNYI